MQTDRKTPLFDKHVALGASMVSYAGFAMPVHYPAGLVAEHMAVRTCAGVFDVSHMGEFMLSGADALENLQRLLTNSFETLKIGGVRYAIMCYENGGTVDDLLVYRTDEREYMLVVNAANREKDFAHIKSLLRGDARLVDVSDDTGLIAVQGPASARIVEAVAGADGVPQKYYSFLRGGALGADCIVSRTGYTGELGFEIYCPAVRTPEIWDALLAAGGDDLAPCGLGARDTLRLEAAMPLYGHELAADITPLEVGLGFAVKPAKADFVGKAALTAAPPARERIGLKVTGRGIAREGAPLYKAGALIGRVTSGTHAPALGFAVAMALVDAGAAQTGDALSAEVRGRMLECQVVEMPFYRAEK